MLVKNEGNSYEDLLECLWCKATKDQKHIIQSKKYNVNMCVSCMKMYVKNREQRKNIRDEQVYVVENDISYIILLSKKGKETGKAIIDTEDIVICKKFRWYKNNKHGYVVANGENNKTIYLHRVIMEKDYLDGMEVDHINNNKLDNRKNNLRICTKTQNIWNRRRLKNNTSGTTGVSFSKKMNKWMSYIRENNKRVHLGYYKNKEDAIEIRKLKEIELYGEFAQKQAT